MSKFKPEKCEAEFRLEAEASPEPQWTFGFRKKFLQRKHFYVQSFRSRSWSSWIQKNWSTLLACHPEYLRMYRSRRVSFFLVLMPSRLLYQKWISRDETKRSCKVKQKKIHFIDSGMKILLRFKVIFLLKFIPKKLKRVSYLSDGNLIRNKMILWLWRVNQFHVFWNHSK